jgi:hypothetical protein
MERDGRMTNPRRPGRDDLARAHGVFRAHESRDLFYRAAIALVGLAKAGTVDLTVGEALAVLLRTWNSAYYRYHPPSLGPCDRGGIHRGAWADRD